MEAAINEKDRENAILELNLISKSGYESHEKVNISANQWEKIMRIITHNEINEFDIKTKKYDEIKAKIEGYYKHNNQIFSNGLCEIVGEDIIKMFGYESNCL